MGFVSLFFVDTDTRNSTSLVYLVLLDLWLVYSGNSQVVQQSLLAAARFVPQISNWQVVVFAVHTDAVQAQWFMRLRIFHWDLTS